MKRVILDMDPGVDDALAIILAMLSPELRVEAITTVSGNVHVDLCTRNVRRVLEVLKPEEPPVIARGEAAPIVATYGRSGGSPIHPLDASTSDNITGADVHGRDGLGDLDRLMDEGGITKRYPEPSLYPVSSDHAVDVILSMVADRPHEITLIPTGPLTNIARAIIQDLERMREVREIVIMGGAFKVPGNATAVAEFNILVDPYAADVVVNSGLPITFVGLDVTRQVRLQESHLECEVKPLNTRLSQFVCDISSVYMDFHRENDDIAGCYLHDPLAVGVVIDPSLVEAEGLYIQVETQGKITSGMTVADLRPVRRRKGSPNVRVCTSVDAHRFLMLFLDTIKAGGLSRNRV